VSERFTVKFCTANVGYVWEVHDALSPKPFLGNRPAVLYGASEPIAKFVYQEDADAFAGFANIANIAAAREKQP